MKIDKTERMIEIIKDNLCSPDKQGYPQAYQFYLDRLLSVPHYSLAGAYQMLALICRCAFWDDCLTFEEFNSIIKIVHDPRTNILIKEINYNEGWN